MNMGQPYANDTFEQEAISKLANAASFGDAASLFNECCIACTFREGGDCGACPIESTLLAVSEVEWNNLTLDDLAYILKERVSC